MWRYWWSLSGPYGFVTEIVASLRAGRHAVVLLPQHAPPGLAAAVAQEVEQDAAWVWTRVPVAAHADGPTALGQTLLGAGTPARSVADLVTHPTLRGRVLWLEIPAAAAWPDWAAFVTAFAAAAEPLAVIDRPLLLLSVTGLASAAGPEPTRLVSVCPWRERLDDLDMQQWAAYLLRPLSLNPVERRLRRELLVALAGFVPRRAPPPSAGSLEDLLHPHALLAACAADRGWLAAPPAPRDWAAGAYDRINGQDIDHLAAQCAAPEGAAQVEERLWRAQMTVFFPLIEQLRRRLVARYRKHLHPPFDLPGGRSILHPEDLEIGPLNLLLSKAPISWSRSELLTRLWTLRNALAHLTPMGYRELKELLLTIERSDLWAC